MREEITGGPGGTPGYSNGYHKLNERADTLIEKRKHSPEHSSYGDQYAEHAEHTRVVILEAEAYDDYPRMLRLITATFSGEHYHGTPRDTSYRRNVVIQAVQYGDGGDVTTLSLSWETAKAFANAIAAWEAEHPAPAPEPDPANEASEAEQAA